MKTALYIRASTAGPDAELQVRELRAYAEQQGWEIVEAYRDSAKTGRPALNRLVTDARAGKFDCLLVWKPDRFGRSLVDCLSNIRTLEENAVRFIAVTQGLDTDTSNPASHVLLHVLEAAAEFERALIQERMQAGRLRYQQDFDAGRVGKGVDSRSGRNLPPHRPRRIFDWESVAVLRARGLSIRAIAKLVGVGAGTVVRTLQPRSKIS